MSDLTAADVLAIACPLCRAPAGDECERHPRHVATLYTVGHIAREPHPARIEAARLATALRSLPVLARPFSGEERAALEGAVRPLIYMAAPVAPTAEQIDALVACFLGAPTADDPPAGIVAARAIATSRIIDDNLRRARRWLRWFSIYAPHLLVIAPWIAAVQSVLEAGAEERTERAREMAVCRDVAGRCYAVAQVGGRVSSGMAEEGEAAGRVLDLTALGEEPPGDGEETERALVVLARVMEGGA